MTTEELDQGLMLSGFIRAGLRLRAAMEAGLSASECPLSPQGLEVLRALGVRGSASRAVLARLVGVRPQSLGIVLEEFEARGWVERVSYPGRKAIVCMLTTAGREMLRRSLAAVGAVEQRLFRGVGPKERAMVLSIITYGARTVEWEEGYEWNPLVRLSRR